jgi:hypothetical protein
MLPSESSITKCQHGVYLSAGSIGDKAAYCRMCCPDPPSDTREVVLPRSSADHLTDEGRTLANKRGNGCPACHSHVWMRVKEDGGDTRRQCAECDCCYSVRLNTHHQALRVLAEMQAAE